MAAAAYLQYLFCPYAVEFAAVMQAGLKQL